VSLRIKFRSATLDQFIERYAVDVSRGGIFIRTREPLPVGTQLRFDFQLQDTAPLLAGEGTIVWIRENDPMRAGVTPGMGVRFDKLTPASQPVLDKILAEKAHREQAGAPSKTAPAGGVAVRRPSSTFSELDPAARAAQAVSGPPRVGGLSPLGAQPRVRAPGTGSGPLAAQPRAAAPTASSGPMATAGARTTEPAINADPFGVGRSTAPVTNTSRTAESAIPAGIPTLESSSAFGRPRSTTGMNAQRTAPAPSALFEKPTADDIDRALSVLTEVEGPAPVLAPVPVDFSSRIRRPTDAAPVVVESAPDVGDAPQSPFDGDVGTAAAARLKLVEREAMVGMDDPRHRGATGRHPAERPRFGGVGVRHVELPPGEQDVQRMEGPQVAVGIDGHQQRRLHDHLEACRGRLIEQMVPASGDDRDLKVSGIEHLRAAQREHARSALQPGDEGGHPQRPHAHRRAQPAKAVASSRAQ